MSKQLSELIDASNENEDDDNDEGEDIDYKSEFYTCFSLMGDMVDTFKKLNKKKTISYEDRRSKKLMKECIEAMDDYMELFTL